ncbi:YncE family protein [Flavobacterium sp. RSSA_27]|uniref:YncE family protein n=1 Tax=Flavobacterium sp. RSSA_27 TaxID=3447667 RepID=UPI003F2FDCBA
MKLTRVLLVAFTFAFLASCSNDDIEDVSKGNYDNGVFILNEGNSSGGSVSFLGDDLTTFKQDVFRAENPGEFLGKYLQSIFFDGDKAFIIASGSNVITVVNRYTFKVVAKIETDLVAPRYGVVKNGKAYVTNANTYSYVNPTTGNTDDYVAVIDLTTYKVESKINLNATANRIVLDGDKLYITEPYNNDKVLVVNTITKALETPITVGSSANTMEVKNGILYVLASPYGSASKIVKVKLSDKSVTEVVFPTALTAAENLDIYGSKIYFTKDTGVYSMDITATQPSDKPIFNYTSTSQYGVMYGFAVDNDKIYIADGGDFASNSKAYVYSLTGALQKELTVGIGPNGIYFNN